MSPAWRRMTSELSDMAVKVGVLGESDAEIVVIAITHELGSPARNIPERSYLRRTFRVRREDLSRVMAQLMRLYMSGRMTSDAAVSALGEWAVAEVRKTITAGPHIPPPLHPATVRRKGSSRPLVDEGRLVGSITWALA